MIFMPVTGYVYSAAGKHSLPWFGLFGFPNLAPYDEVLARAGQRFHYLGAWAIGLLLCAHLAAVVWHFLVKRDEVLARMAPSLAPKRRGGA